jgi:hypothetical protein
MRLDQIKNSIIVADVQNNSIFIPPPSYSIGLYSHQGNEINLKKWFMKAFYGDVNSVKILFNEYHLTTHWWEFIREHKSQFLNKILIKNNIVLLKKIYNVLSFNHQTLNKNFNLDELDSFIKNYDFCNQVLTSGKYFDNKIDSSFFNLLSEQQTLDLMKNHIVILEDKLELSTLQNNSNQDTLNHILTHTILEFWKFQGWI